MTGAAGYFEAAGRVAEALDRDLLDADRGACRDRAGGGAIGILGEPHYPLADNVATAEALMSYASLGGGNAWNERAAGMLSALAGEAARHGVMGAGHALAAARSLAEPVVVHIVGSADDPALQALLRAAWSAYAPGRVTEILDRESNAGRLASLGYPVDGPARAFVCIGERCLAPVTEADALTRRLADRA